MKKLLTLTVLVATLAITHARIGETMEQATVRYGTPTLKDDGWTHFHKGEFFIGVKFYQGKIDTIEYVKYVNGRDVELSEVEVTNFLKANNNGKWVVIGHKEWSSPGLWAFQDLQQIIGGGHYYRLQIFTFESRTEAS